ncbi:S8 family peptidase [Bacillus sp. 1NLA3E]|uniref:S8 family peptidase n=1 Tax=Bacillus sp. 1NLA3E TaxID=666686 RepID=UPI000247E934|nr:S8 family peptidase [Bacillus sp. 1NLA3E]AGK52188.1 intracellular alkaline serine proteinase [Bacillus sp. 1NLA3E]
MKLSYKLLSMSAAVAMSTGLLYGVTTSTNLPINQKAVHAESASKEIIFQAKSGFDAKDYIKSIGGSIEQEVDLINGYIARVPADRLDQVKAQNGITNVSESHRVESTTQKIGEDNVIGKALGQRNTHNELIKATNVQYTGTGVTVAVLDSGVGAINELNVTKSVAINPDATTTTDLYGHGTHVAGIISGDSIHTGVAPNTNIISVKLGTDGGYVDEVDLLLGLQWVFDYKDEYNIKVVNLSVSSTISQSYLDNPISAAVEQLWLNGVIVVTAAGNDQYNQSDINYAPANDPFVITVGALDGEGEYSASLTKLASWSKFGVTPEGVTKPELNAPGVDIVSYLSSETAILAKEHPEAVYNNNYIEMSGTSMAAPVITGAIALLLEANPDLTPNQIKYLLTQTAQPTATAGSNIIDVEKAIGLAKNKDYLNNLNLSNYNNFEQSQYINPSGNTVDYSKLSWHSLEWLKLSWHNVDWAKLSWKSQWDSIGQSLNN